MNHVNRRSQVSESALTLQFIAGIANFKFKDFYTAVEDLSACVKLDKDNTSAYTYLVSLKDSNPVDYVVWYPMQHILEISCTSY